MKSISSTDVAIHRTPTNLPCGVSLHILRNTKFLFVGLEMNANPVRIKLTRTEKNQQRLERD